MSDPAKFRQPRGKWKMKNEWDGNTNTANANTVNANIVNASKYVKCKQIQIP